MKKKDSFTARTRVRGTVSYYQAKWELCDPGEFVIEFVDGPYLGRRFLEKHCAIAKDDAWKRNKLVFGGIL